MGKNRLLSAIFFICLVFSLNFIAAQPAKHLGLTYRIVGNTVLAEISSGPGEIIMNIPKEVDLFEINTANYSILDFNNYGELIAFSEEKIIIKYTSNSFIEKSGKKTFFISKIRFDNKINLTLFLPESAVLTEPKIIYPYSYDILTDGRSILLNWKDFSSNEILVAYEFIEKGFIIYYLIIFFLIFSIVLFYFFHRKKLEKEKRMLKEKIKSKIAEKPVEEILVKNLFEDEKKIVQYLLSREKNECWTKEILRDLGLSKVKLSRKLRALEQKEIIKKIPYGNENIIRLVKK